MTNDLTSHTLSQLSQTSGNGADAQPCPASPSDLAWLTRAGTGFERYVLLEAAGARVCTAAAFAHTARVRFQMGVPRAYGFIQPKWEVHGDGAVGDDRVLSFDMAWDGYVNGVDCYHCEVNIADILNGAQDGLFFYHYVLCDGVYYVRDALGYFTRREETYLHRLLVYTDGTSLPKWVGDGFIYQIFVDRFCDSGRKKPCKPGARLHREWEGGTPEFAARRGDPIDNRDFFGGDLWGVCDKLDELKAMGVGTLYLSPVFDAASNHKYDIGDYEHVDAMFGGDAALIALFEQAHARGMHVILDGVFNHTGSDSRLSLIHI